MEVYEKAIADAVDSIAGRKIYFRPEDIMGLDDDTAERIVGEFLSWACRPQNELPISIGRKCLTAFPTDWVSEKIKKTADISIDITDDWEYRRLLELCDLISPQLLSWGISLGEGSTDPYIIETVEDFK